MTTANHRTADHPIDPMFLERWSPRAFTGEPLAESDLLTMLEAARWAPSSSNAQPWRFVYARRDTAAWPRLLGLLVPANQAWATDASALVVLFSKTTMRYAGKDQDVPSPTHSLDAGTASGYLALQALRMGWHTHGMGGFDRDRAIAELGVPAGFRAEAVYAVGRLGDPAKLPEPLRARERPSARLPLAQLAFEGTFQPAGE
jgi:nitroreductase